MSEIIWNAFAVAGIVWSVVFGVAVAWFSVELMRAKKTGATDA